MGFERVELAANQALTVALLAGDVDLIVSDWLWAMRQRAEGEQFLFAPYSSALGALMAPAGGVATLSDLKGRRIGVAGSALDKSWLLLRAHAREAVGGDLASVAEPVYGAPPLLSEQIRLGRIDAVLTYWNFAARLDAAGLRRIVDMAEVVASLGVEAGAAARRLRLAGVAWRSRRRMRSPPSSGPWRQRTRSSAASDAAWERLRPAMQAEERGRVHAPPGLFPRRHPGALGRGAYALGRAPVRHPAGARRAGAYRRAHALRRRPLRQGRRLRSGPWRRFLTRLAWPALSLAAFLALWSLVALFADTRLLPGPAKVWQAFLAAAGSGALVYHICVTLARVAASFLIAMAGRRRDRPRARPLARRQPALRSLARALPQPAGARRHHPLLCLVRPHRGGGRSRRSP